MDQSDDLNAVQKSNTHTNYSVGYEMAPWKAHTLAFPKHCNRLLMSHSKSSSCLPFKNTSVQNPLYTLVT